MQRLKRGAKPQCPQYIDILRNTHTIQYILVLERAKANQSVQSVLAGVFLLVAFALLAHTQDIANVATFEAPELITISSTPTMISV